jgi:peptide/nickel transport system permease protein
LSQETKNKPVLHPKRSQIAEIWRRFRKNRLAVAGLLILAALVCLALFADVLYDYDTVVIKQNIQARLQGPNATHPLGNDELGRDILARIVHGSRISLVVGLISVSIALVTGGTLGAIAGFYGGRIDNVIMRIMDIFLAMPSILLAITIVAALGSSMLNLMIAVGLSSMPTFARVVRSAVMSVRNQEFIESARTIGAKDFTIIWHHIIPNSLAPVIVMATLRVATAILATASLSFIGLGVQPPMPEWGAMLSGGRNYLRDAWHITFFPGLFIMITILALNIVGDGLRDALDPRLKK